MPLSVDLIRVICLQEEQRSLQVIHISYYLALLRGHGEVVGGTHDSLREFQSSNAGGFKY